MRTIELCIYILSLSVYMSLPNPHQTGDTKRGLLTNGFIDTAKV